MELYWYFALGFLAQGLFSARMIIQWFLSEKSRRVVSPMIYWQLSLFASFLLSVYGWLREDFAIVLGQLFSYYIYIWNLYIKGGWQKMNGGVRLVLSITPVVVFAMFLAGERGQLEGLFDDSDIPMWLIVFGSVGQIVFMLRFVYQWWYSKQRGESLLPPLFWVLSLIGSACIILYGVFRKDPVLIIGQGAGFLTYSRNLYIDKRSKQQA